MSYDFQGFAQQGWQCPICKRVYSPTTSMCAYCGISEVETTTSMNIHSYHVPNLTRKELEQMLDQAKEDSSNSYLMNFGGNNDE